MSQLLPGTVRVVFFDAADTLFRVRGGVGRQYALVARRHGASFRPEDISRAFGRAFRAAPPLAFDVDSGSVRRDMEKRWWYGVVKEVFSELGMFAAFDSFFDDLYETFRASAWELFPETASVLKALKGSGFELGVITNFDSRVYEVIDTLGIADYFDSITISSEAGYAKPSTEIFRRALARHGAAPGEALHVGDDLRNDYLGAREAGLRPVLLQRDGASSAGDGAVVKVDTLYGVERLLRSGSARRR